MELLLALLLLGLGTEVVVLLFFVFDLQKKLNFLQLFVIFFIYFTSMGVLYQQKWFLWEDPFRLKTEPFHHRFSTHFPSNRSCTESKKKILFPN